MKQLSKQEVQQVSGGEVDAPPVIGSTLPDPVPPPPPVQNWIAVPLGKQP